MNDKEKLQYVLAELKEILDKNSFDIPTYAPTMRSHFDVEFMRRLCSTKLDFDLVMSHLPEHTHPLKKTLRTVVSLFPRGLSFVQVSRPQVPQ